MAGFRNRADVGRSDEELARAERELALPDPIDQQHAPQLAALLHPDAVWWVDQFRRFLHESLAPMRRDVPIQAPAIEALRPMVWQTVNGHDGQPWDASPAWRAIFGTANDAVQGRLRTLFHTTRGLKFPAIDDRIVTAVCELIIGVFQAAAEQQAARLARRAERQGPVVKAQAAAALLEALPTFRDALLAFSDVMKDAAGAPGYVHPIAMGLQRLEAAARRELS